ncbi:MAG: hypothetical protein F9K44_02580 [Hyphomicrobiaceae bacterium]|nr:MAG: hypothetical protein F9K44_02580 [Hyphomicrobiaceae bacterium]
MARNDPAPTDKNLPRDRDPHTPLAAGERARELGAGELKKAGTSRLWQKAQDAFKRICGRAPG